MGTYEFLPHTADEKFHVVADSLEDAFATCVSAFYEIMVPDQQVETKETRKVTVSGKRLRSLLYDFLNELVFYFDDEDLILQHVDTLSIVESEEGYQLSATLSGDTMYDYDVITEIKNMTYSEMSISGPGTENSESDSGKVEVTVVVDI